MPPLRVRYQTIEVGEMDVHLRTLRDRQQFQDDDGEAEGFGIGSASWPLFGVVWDASVVLAHLMLKHDIQGLRILEVGCGIALTSLVLHRRAADITATDHNPEAGVFLRQNVVLNAGVPLPFVRTGWDDRDSGMGLFNLIVGSDLLYEPDHAASLSGFIDHHASPVCTVILVDARRGGHGRFCKSMQGRGYEHQQQSASDHSTSDRPFRGDVHTYTRQASADRP